MIHFLIGLALIYFYSELPKALTVFLSVFFIMSFVFVYWGVVLVDSLLS